MTAFNLLRSVLYENRSESQGSFYVHVNDRYFFLEQLDVMFGKHVVSCDNFHDSDFSGHWFYSYGYPVSLPNSDSSRSHSLEVAAEFSIRLASHIGVFLYHIDWIFAKPIRDGGNGWALTLGVCHPSRCDSATIFFVIINRRWALFFLRLYSLSRALFRARVVHCVKSCELISRFNSALRALMFLKLY